MTIAAAIYVSFVNVRDIEESVLAQKIIRKEMKGEQSQDWKEQSMKSFRSMSSFNEGDGADEILELHNLLSGKEILAWAKSIKEMPEDVRQNLARTFEVVNQGIKDLKDDVTHYSTSRLAETLRNLNQLDDLVDYLCTSSAEDRTAMLHFVESYAAFSEESLKSPNQSQYSTLVLPEHKPVLVSWMMRCPAADMKHLLTIFRNIRDNQDGKLLGFNVSFGKKNVVAPLLPQIADSEENEGKSSTQSDNPVGTSETSQEEAEASGAKEDAGAKGQEIEVETSHDRPEV
eukprot:CAMPEP_0184307298 /NCGR_PEP_ID=MMETSP1049-20130417/16063_1 /TAXON_ID=77928 /ORGANISM="Proteomonas sulcata, Strain CCMP704" /LENGTH=286 /DNA_ID=CAMNT_0026619765 /DNA_START=50 /DNA_END=910 /DNA_ORIENTATION=-